MSSRAISSSFRRVRYHENLILPGIPLTIRSAAPRIRRWSRDDTGRRQGIVSGEASARWSALIVAGADDHRRGRRHGCFRRPVAGECLRYQGPAGDRSRSVRRRQRAEDRSCNGGDQVNALISLPRYAFLVPSVKSCAILARLLWFWLRQVGGRVKINCAVRFILLRPLMPVHCQTVQVVLTRRLNLMKSTRHIRFITIAAVSRCSRPASRL